MRFSIRATKGYFFPLGALCLVAAASLCNFPPPNEKKKKPLAPRVVVYQIISAIYSSILEQFFDQAVNFLGSCLSKVLVTAVKTFVIFVIFQMYPLILTLLLIMLMVKQRKVVSMSFEIMPRKLINVLFRECIQFIQSSIKNNALMEFYTLIW